MHIVHTKIKELARSDQNAWYRFNMYCMSLLVNVRTLHEFDTILEDIVVCLSGQKQTKMLLVAYHELSVQVKNMNKD